MPAVPIAYVCKICMYLCGAVRGPTDQRWKIEVKAVVENHVKQPSMMTAISFCNCDFTFGSSTA